MCQCGFIDSNECTTLESGTDSGGRLCLCRGRGYMGTLCTFGSILLCFSNSKVCTNHKDLAETPSSGSAYLGETLGKEERKGEPETRGKQELKKRGRDFNIGRKPVGFTGRTGRTLEKSAPWRVLSA